ncbi:hypothetical protein NCCP2145_13060 [Pseudarthrobacter sp. NCCP-2145]|nr:hypothetical protein NCCP2145_13060 [Pseudarthrobacter sp. NCCP-2145]
MVDDCGIDDRPVRSDENGFAATRSYIDSEEQPPSPSLGLQPSFPGTTGAPSAILSPAPDPATAAGASAGNSFAAQPCPF